MGLLDHAFADQSRTIARWIAKRLVSEYDPLLESAERTNSSNGSAADVPTVGLASHMNGLALLFSGLEECVPGESWRRQALATMKLVTSNRANERGLFTGWGGVLAAAECLAGDSDAYKNLRIVLRREVSKIDGENIDSLRSSWSSVSSYDLISGAAGQVLALSNTDLDVTETPVYRKLISMASIPDAMAFLSLVPVQNKSDAADLKMGLAHGIAGVIAALSFTARSKSDLSIVAQLVEVLESYTIPDQVGASWPYSSSRRGVAFYPAAWCTGTLGIAVSLVAAASALCRPDLMDLAAEAIRGSLLRNLSKTVADYSICHGLSGQALIAYCVGRATRSQELVTLAQDIFVKIITEFDEDHKYGFPLVSNLENEPSVDPAGILGGSAGIALSLLEASSQYPGRWTRYLGLPPDSK